MIIILTIVILFALNMLNHIPNYRGTPESKINFHATFATEASHSFATTVTDAIHYWADSITVNQVAQLNVDGVIIAPLSCHANVYPVNYTLPSSTWFPTMTQTSTIVLPTTGMTEI